MAKILPKPVEGNEPVSLKIKAKTFKLNSEPNPKRTMTILALFVILAGLALLVSYFYDNVNNHHQNNTRKQDLRYISSELTGYHVLYGYYPTLKFVNSPTFASFAVALNRNKFKDPSGSNDLLLSTVSSGSYAYKPLPAGCNNQMIKCSAYKLTAVLSEGQDYSISSKAVR